MSIESLKERLPDYAKDLKLNLSSLANEPALNEQQRAGAFVATALAARNEVTSKALLAEFAPRLSPEAFAAAKAAAAIMAMNNIYYRFTHLASAPDYKTMPARLTIAPTDRSMPPRPERITSISARPSMARGTALIRLADM